MSLDLLIVPRLAALAVVMISSVSCGPRSDEATALLRDGVVYGSDDRLEYFEVNAPELRAAASQSMVALVPKEWLAPSPNRVDIKVPSWGDVGGLCPEERFTAQPALALCSGVLVDWDLVLTAGHCVRQISLDHLAIVFGYYYSTPDELSIGDADVLEAVEIVSEALDPEDRSPRLDYAWLRLSGPGVPPRRPAPIRAGPHALAAGDPVVAVGTGGGVPMKFDSGATVREVRDPWFDFFVADADTTKGSSGGAAFDAELALAGILARGAPDLVRTERGCQITAHRAGADEAAEHFTYAWRALEGLCADDPSASSLCRRDCGNPCRALPRFGSSDLAPGLAPVGGCSIASSPVAGHSFLWCVVMMFARSARLRCRDRRWRR